MSKSTDLPLGAFPGLPGESWEDYAHRLERRIKEQRDAIERHQELRNEGNIHARKKIAMLERSLGKACITADRRKEQRDEVIQKVRALKRAITNACYLLDESEPVSAYEWLRTTYPPDHPAYVDPDSLPPGYADVPHPPLPIGEVLTQEDLEIMAIDQNE